MSGSSGGELGAAFYREVVGPLITRELPRLGHAAARLGSGSDVLGLDDPMSRDHDWGLRLTLLVDEADQPAVRQIRDLLDAGLPARFRGHPVRFPTSWDAAVSHRVGVDTISEFAASRLGVSPVGGLSSLDWLVLTGQGVLEVIAGHVYADSTTGLASLRRYLAWYLPDVERYVLACGWHRLAQRMHYVGRTADTGQPLQSRLLSAGLASDLISLAFLLHRQWEPYEKWREALFTRLPCAAAMAPLLNLAVCAAGWAEREQALAAAIEMLATVQRLAGLPTPGTVVTKFIDRPYLTVCDAVVDLLLAEITDPPLARLAVQAGSVAQWADSVDVLAHPARRAALVAVYRDWQQDAPGG